MATYEIAALDSPLEFDVTNAVSTSVDRVPTKDWVICSWIQSTSAPFVQVFSKNPTTGAMAAIGSPLDLGSAGVVDEGTSVVAINSTNAIVFYNGASSDGFAQLLTIDGSGNVTANGSPLEYDIVEGSFPCIVLWDSTHVLNTRSGTGNDGYAQVFSFDTGAGTITALGTPLEFDTTEFSTPSLVKVKSGQAAVLYRGGVSSSRPMLQSLIVNESTRAVTAGSSLEIANFGSVTDTSLALIGASGSNNLVLAAFNYAPVSGQRRYLGVFTIGNDNSVTQLGTLTDIGVSSTVLNTYGISVSMIDRDNAVVVYYEGTAGDTLALSVNINTNTGAISTIDTITFYTNGYAYPSITSFSDGTFVTARSGSSFDGFIQGIEVSAIAAASNGNFFMFM